MAIFLAVLERKMNEKSPTPVKEPPTFRVTTPLEDGQNLNKVGQNFFDEFEFLDGFVKIF